MIQKKVIVHIELMIFIDIKNYESEQISEKNVNKIMKQKERRRNYSKEAYNYINKPNEYNTAGMNEDEPHMPPNCTRQFGSDNVKKSQNRIHKYLMKETSRNYMGSGKHVNSDHYEGNKYIHQTTSSGNLVLYDSAAGTSTQSPQEYIDSNYIPTQIPQNHHKNFDENYNEDLDESKCHINDSGDILQDEKITGTIPKINHKL
jgi:hypothetical protein